MECGPLKLSAKELGWLYTMHASLSRDCGAANNYYGSTKHIDRCREIILELMSKYPNEYEKIKDTWEEYLSQK